VTFARFLAAVQKARHWLDQETKPLPDPSTTKKSPLFVKTDYRIRKVDLDSICYLQALRDYIAIHLQTSRILTLDSMKNMEEHLPPGQFIRIHKSYIINIDKIEFLSRGSVMVNKVHLPVGNTYKERFQQLIGIPEEWRGKGGEK